MSISTESTAGASGQPATRAETSPAGGPLLTGAAGDRCTSCNARLAVDQRYCVECGTRRGNPRFTLARVAAEPQAMPVGMGQLAGAAVTRVQLLLALVIVLVALGVGVLIGLGASKTPRVIVNGTVSSASAPKARPGGASRSSGSGAGSSSSSQPFSTGS